MKLKSSIKFSIFFAILFTLIFTTKAFATLTISNTGIVGDSSFNNLTIPGISSAGCLTINSSGVVSSTGSACGSGGGGGSGTVTSVGLVGTTNQITITGTSPIISSGSFTLSIPNNPTLPGTTTGTFSGNLTGTASTATNLAGGLGGSIPYQTGAGATSMLANGTVGQVLTSAGTTLAPTWTTIGGGSGDMILASVQTITGAKTFGTIGGTVGKLILAGSASGSTILNAAATAGSGTVVLPTTGTLATLAGSEAFTNKDLTGAGNTFPTFNQDTTGKSAKTDALNSVTTAVNVSSATAPSTGQVLTATDSTHATWQAATGGVGVSISTSGPVSDPGGVADIQYNNAAGALTFNAPAGVNGYQRCYRNATGKSGVITVQMAASNTVDLTGANGTSAGTLVSGGALADAVCIVSDATNHWYAYVSSGSWTNN
jgi:hypothetical protein